MPPETDPAERLALAKVKRAKATADTAIARRDDTIREAVTGGLSVRKVAVAAGLSFQRVHQISHEAS